MDTSHPPAEPAALLESSPLVRWAGPLFAVTSLALVPWIVFAAITLPSRQVSANYDVAWAGYDVMLLAALAATTIAALRRSLYLGLAASSSGALLVVDAWFDVLTAPSQLDRLEAVVMALLVELPLAAVCGWLALHTQDITERRLQLLMRRSRRERGRPGSG